MKLIDPFDVPYLAWYDCDARKWNSPDFDRIMTTKEMLSVLIQGYRAHVVNHRGYRSYVELDENNELNWHFPPQSYESEFYIFDLEDYDKLRWIIR